VEAVAKPLIQFSEDGLLMLNIALGFIMFGIALNIDRKEFKEITRYPKSVAVGLASQFLLLPFITFLLIYFLKPIEGIAMGMILVASCPGGNVSNYITFLSKGNIALSIALTTAATLLAIVFTPLNFSIYSQWYAGNMATQSTFQLDTFSMIKSIATLIALPLAVGLVMKEYFSNLTKKIEKSVKILSMLLFFSFIVLALVANYKVFLAEIENIFLVVLLHNAFAFLTGFSLASIFRLPLMDKKTITVETGIQNSGLGLVLIFNYFNGNPDMALIAAWWGVWHIVSGFALSMLLKRL